MYKIQTLNKISSKGLNHFPLDNYEVASEINNPDAILVRSQDMHEMELAESENSYSELKIGRLDVGYKSPLESRLKSVLKRFDILGRTVGGKDYLLALLVERVEGVEELLLC